MKGLLEACSLCAGKSVDIDVINGYLIEKGLLTVNMRSDRQRPDAWRDYQQILSELGLIYSTKIVPTILLTPVAIAFLDGTISYEELITLQILKYQYPNGHKTQMSPSLRESLGGSASRYSSFTELQYNNGILVRPAVVIWSVMTELLRAAEAPCLSVDELQKYVVRCLSCSDIPFCVSTIIQVRHDGIALPALSRARRNMADWIKILDNSPLFSMDDLASTLYLSEYSLQHIDEIQEICESLCKPDSFWLPTGQDDKVGWFSFYGNLDISINLIPAEATPTMHADENEAPNLPAARSVLLQPFNSIANIATNPTKKQIVSVYDYTKSQRGHTLHDSMVNLIAQKCVSKGATVFSDPRTVDLCARYKDTEYLIEVKSITPSNFIARLRYAIGQVHQYNYLLPIEHPYASRQLSLAFTADIPEDSWIIPFVTGYMQMDLLSLRASELHVRSRLSLSLELFGA